MEFKELHFPEIDSTSSFVKRSWMGLAPFTFVSAFYQSEGRGRNERAWLSEEGSSLLFSLLIKESPLLSLGGFLSLPSAVAIASIIEELGVEGVAIKWPNDIYIKGKKVAGILLEGSLPDFLVIGIGINVKQKAFEGEFRQPPTSLFLETGTDIDIHSFKGKVFQRLLETLFDKDMKQHCLEYFRTHDYLYGKMGTHSLEKEKGRFLGVDEEFNLIFDDGSNLVYLHSGEVSSIECFKEED